MPTVYKQYHDLGSAFFLLDLARNMSFHGLASIAFDIYKNAVFLYVK